MYRVDRNNFYERQKKSTIQTPAGVSQFIYELLHDKVDRANRVLDPCVGEGSLLNPWKKSGFKVIGIDIEDQGFPGTRVRNYLTLTRRDIRDTPGLVVMNPPIQYRPEDQETLG